MKEYLELINTQTSGNRNDITPVFRDFGAFQALTTDICELVRDYDFDLVAGIDALGFILGTAISLKTEKGFLSIRKGNKLPIEVDYSNFVEFEQKIKGAIKKHGPLSLVVAWIHDHGEKAHQVIADIIEENKKECRYFRVMGSGDRSKLKKLLEE